VVVRHLDAGVCQATGEAAQQVDLVVHTRELVGDGLGRAQTPEMVTVTHRVDQQPVVGSCEILRHAARCGDAASLIAASCAAPV